MTEAFEKYVYPYLHTKESDYIFDGNESVKCDREYARRIVKRKFQDTICKSCENFNACPFHSVGHEVISQCNYYGSKT